ncbi:MULTISPECIES: TetR/AcrR family transcriptional regulator [Kitasatospora]|uniref:Putative TetR family transcriptional regulator n=1 Tax=Kitasatospora setae (strain ATCC 33774 / DSM 43861 / JCM 3304 / KCC A-0304 / NBRC 14216 / KM-6054) TaxID=452652 RepID=E4N7M2_KITSK|nr:MULTISPECIES: TetR/AcrR family transcriptional regulator [Kitasatospora]BAJ27203.1 putative TetR family transcriptional regulator [Kitasatospora setae KM-6054]
MSSGEEPELIWLRPEYSGRGPRPAHSRTSIARAALGLADREGLDAVTMRRVAAELGAGTMSLYNYVPKKEHLFDLLVDLLAEEYDLPAEPSGDPRADLTMLARQLRGILTRHGWATTLITHRPSLGPNGLRVTEFHLATLAGTPLGGTAKMEAFSQLTGYVCQFTDWQQRSAQAGARWLTDLVRYLQTATATGRYPNLTATLAESGAPPDPDAAFERGLQRLITALLTAD